MTSPKDLEFLSSAKDLEVLEVFRVFPPDLDVADLLEPTSFPNLSTLRFRAEKVKDIEGCRQLMAKIVPFTVSSLDFGCNMHGGSDIGPLVDFIRAKPSIRNLRVESWTANSTLPSIPRSIKRLELSHRHVARIVAMWLRDPGSSPAQNLRLLKSSDCDVLSVHIMRLRDHFVKLECNQVRFQFEDCEGMDDGTYDLADVHAAVHV